MNTTNRGEFSPLGLLSELLYINYAENRDRAPHISAERWVPHYPNAAELEARYQAEKAIEKASQ